MTDKSQQDTAMNEERRYHLVKRKKGGKVVYYARFLGDGVDAKGNAVYLLTKSTGETSKVRARQIVQKWLTEGLLFASTEGIRDYFIEFWDPKKSEYLRTKEVDSGRKISVSYCRNNQRLLEDYFIPYFEQRGIATIRDLNHNLLLQWRNDLATGQIKPARERAHGREPGPISAVHGNKIRQAAWVPLEWAVQEGKLPAHPGARVKRIAERQQVKASREKRAAAVLELAEARKLFLPEHWRSNYSDDSISRAAALFCFATGARQGEARGLMFENLDIEQGYCHILWNFQDDEGLKPPKWESVRKDIPLPDMVLDAIRGIIAVYPHPLPIQPGDFVFPNLSSRENPVHKATMGKSLKRALARAGIQKSVGFHDLRHSWASHSVNLPQAIRQQVLGHRSAEMTDGTYTHATAAGREALREFSRTLLSQEQA